MLIFSKRTGDGEGLMFGSEVECLQYELKSEGFFNNVSNKLGQFIIYMSIDINFLFCN